MASLEIFDGELDNLPSDPNFCRELAVKIDEDVEIYYDREECGWAQFRDDVLFILKNEGKVTRYQDVTLYWSRVKDDTYVVMKALKHSSFNTPLKCRTLVEVLRLILIEDVEIYAPYNREPLQADFKLSNEFKEILTVMLERNKAQVDSLLQELESDKFIEIRDFNSNFSFYPLSMSIIANLFLDRGKLIISGLKAKSAASMYCDEKVYLSPYAISIAPDDVALVLATLAYNPKTYNIKDIEYAV